MKRILAGIAFAAMAIAPSAALAQSVPPAVIAIVDLEKVQATCTACKTAAAALVSQANAIQARRKALATPLETEQKSIQAAIDALKGQEPDAALKARATAFQNKYQQAQEELARSEQQLQRNQAYISQQINAKLGPIYRQVMQRRGANMMMEIGATVASGANLDVTNDVLAALNTALPSVQTIAPAAAQKPQGR